MRCLVEPSTTCGEVNKTVVNPGRYQLVIAIMAEALVAGAMEAVRAAGGRSVTVLRGRGRDLVNPPSFFGVPIEPGREILMLVVDSAKVPTVMEAIDKAGELTTPNRGIAFAIELTHVAGLLSETADPGERPGSE